MYFSTKNYLKNTCNHTVKHAFTTLANPTGTVLPTNLS
jgi:hypothetical protein